MFSGFPVTNTPAVQVWDFSRAGASINAIRSVFLTDDCAPIQFFKTGASVLIDLYLPLSYPEGKLIKIINSPFSSSAQSINIYSSEARGNTFGQSGTGIAIYTVNPGNILELFYTKANLFPTTAGFTVTTGWISTSHGSANSFTYGAFAVPGSTVTAGSAFAATGATASGGNSVAMGGQGANASGSSAIAIGGGASASASESVAIGSGAYADAGTAMAIGRQASTRGVEGRIALAASLDAISAFRGLCQTGILALGRQTTDATATILRSNSGAAGTANQLTLPNNSAYYVRGSCIATVTGGGNTKAWSFEAAIKRGANAAATSIVGAVIKNIVAADAGAATWDITISADTTNGALAVSVTGQAATTIRWVCRLDSTEVTY